MKTPDMLRFMKSAARAMYARVNGYAVFAPKVVRQQRTKVCRGCPEFDSGARQCKACTCFIDAKVSVLVEECPAKRWGAIWKKKDSV